MALKETSLAKVLEKTSGTSYFSAFVQLVGKAENFIFYEGISRDDEQLIKELEDVWGYQVSNSYLRFLSITNGGAFASMTLFSLDSSDNVNSLYYRNFKTDVRKKNKIPDNVLVIGEYADGVICLQQDDEDSSFALVDTYSKEKLEFYFFEDLITFRIYYRLLEGGKKKIEEKEKMKLAAKKLHDSIVKENKERKKISEKALLANNKKASKAGLKQKKRSVK